MGDAAELVADRLPGATGEQGARHFDVLIVGAGLSGIGAAALGWLADGTSIEFVYFICAGLPVLGLLAAFLPDIGGASARAKVIAASA